MMTIREAFENIIEIRYPDGSPRVVETVAKELAAELPAGGRSGVLRERTVEEKGVFNIAVAGPWMNKASVAGVGEGLDDYIFFQAREDGSGWLIASHPHFLYSFFRHIVENLIDKPVDQLGNAKAAAPAFSWQRVSYDYFLTQEGRLQRGLDRAGYVRELARLGFTHIEVNGLAYPMGLETGPKGEVYPMFYTYCPALDQFVYSELNKGLYPYYYLSANLAYLKENARLSAEYGLVPGLLCFEPRSVPERFFDKYPMLRGARVDHPFRSFKPRYNMTITHPKVRGHYAEMLRKLMDEVPELGFMSVWTNDSGAGFEHTKSLYVGRNGGAYMIREWKDDAEIARLAGENAIKFFRTLRDAAADANPDFRVITRMESFYGEYDAVWNGLENRLDVETASLISRGWAMPYRHPKYPDVKEINAGTVYHQGFDEKEKEGVAELDKRGSRAHFYFADGPRAMFEPLIGVPYPWLTRQRLKTLRGAGVKYLARSGGTFPKELAPYNINHEVARLFQYAPEMNIDDAVRGFALRWAGERFAGALVEAWELAGEAVIAFPNLTPLYSTFGFTWYRLWSRPFVPNIEDLPQSDRDYYKNFMCTTPHNPNNVDLSRDVLFNLFTPEKALVVVGRIDRALWPPLDKAIKILNERLTEAGAELGGENVIYDQLIRLRALRSWFMTQRNVAAWTAGVYGYMNEESEGGKKMKKELLMDSIEKEIANSRELLELLGSDVEFMALSGQGETPLMYGPNLSAALVRRIELMEAHINDEPFIDHGYIERKAGELIS